MKSPGDQWRIDVSLKKQANPVWDHAETKWYGLEFNFRHETDKFLLDKRRN